AVELPGAEVPDAAGEVAVHVRGMVKKDAQGEPASQAVDHLHALRAPGQGQLEMSAVNGATDGDHPRHAKAREIDRKKGEQRLQRHAAITADTGRRRKSRCPAAAGSERATGDGYSKAVMGRTGSACCEGPRTVAQNRYQRRINSRGCARYNRASACLRGRRALNTVPFSSEDSAIIVPPCRVTISCAM